MSVCNAFRVLTHSVWSLTYRRTHTHAHITFDYTMQCAAIFIQQCSGGKSECNQGLDLNMRDAFSNECLIEWIHLAHPCERKTTMQWQLISMVCCSATFFATRVSIMDILRVFHYACAWLLSIYLKVFGCFFGNRGRIHVWTYMHAHVVNCMRLQLQMPNQNSYKFVKIGRVTA